MVKWKSNAISGFKVSFFRQNAKEFCSCQKISKANNWISFLGKYEIDDDKKGGFFFTFYWIGEDQCKKISYTMYIALQSKSKNGIYLLNIFSIFITGKIQYLQGTDH